MLTTTLQDAYLCEDGTVNEFMEWIGTLDTDFPPQDWATASCSVAQPESPECLKEILRK